MTLLGLLLAASVGLPLVAAAEKNVTVDQLYGKLTSTATPAPGFNAEGGSVFTNYADLVNNGQLFIHRPGTFVFEKPETAPVQYTAFEWCSDLTFSDISNATAPSSDMLDAALQESWPDMPILWHQELISHMTIMKQTSLEP